MAGKGAWLVLTFACMQVAASMNDENCLVQSQKDVMHYQAVLQPNDPMGQVMQKIVRLQLPASVRSIAKQLQIPLPECITDKMNMTQQEMLMLGMEVLAWFRNETIKEFIFDSLLDVRAGVLAYSNWTVLAVQNLSAVIKTAASKAEVLEVLNDFLTSQADRGSKKAVNIAMRVITLAGLLPNGKMKTMLKPARDAIEGLTPDEMAVGLFRAVEPMIQRTTSSQDLFCQRYKTVARLISMAHPAWKNASEMMDMAAAMTPQIQSMVEGVAPDVASDVTKFVNLSMSAAIATLTSFKTLIPEVERVLHTEIAEKHMGCAYNFDAKAAEGAAARGWLSLACAVAAVAVWALSV